MRPRFFDQMHPPAASKVMVHGAGRPQRTVTLDMRYSDARWRQSLCEQEPIARDRVVHRGRKRMLGCKAIVQSQHAGLRGARDAAHQIAMGIQGAHYIAAAM